MSLFSKQQEQKRTAPSGTPQDIRDSLLRLVGALARAAAAAEHRDLFNFPEKKYG